MNLPGPSTTRGGHTLHVTPDRGCPLCSSAGHPHCGPERAGKGTTMPINSVHIIEAQHTPGALYEWRDAAGSTWQMTDADGRRAGYTRISDDPMPTGSGRPKITYDYSGVTPARQVGDATRA